LARIPTKRTRRTIKGSKREKTAKKKQTCATQEKNNANQTSSSKARKKDRTEAPDVIENKEERAVLNTEQRIGKEVTSKAK